MYILTRPSKPQDLSFVFDSWLNSWRHNRFAGVIANHLYFDTQRQTIEGLLARGAQVVIAYPEGRPDHILGWVCTEEKEGRCVLHYLYVKDAYLSYPVEDGLLAAVSGAKPGFITHLFSPKYKLWKHAPEIARRKTL